MRSVCAIYGVVMEVCHPIRVGRAPRHESNHHLTVIWNETSVTDFRCITNALLMHHLETLACTICTGV